MVQSAVTLSPYKKSKRPKIKSTAGLVPFKNDLNFMYIQFSSLAEFKMTIQDLALLSPRPHTLPLYTVNLPLQ